MQCRCCDCIYEAEENEKGFVQCPQCRVYFKDKEVSYSRRSINNQDLDKALKNNPAKFIPVFNRITSLTNTRDGFFDVCCGIGGSCVTAREFGFERVTGCDVNIGHIEIAKQFYNLELHNAEIEHLNIEEEFAVVMSFHGIEHVSYPYVALEKMLDMSTSLVYLEHPCTYRVEEMQKSGHVHEWSLESFRYLIRRLKVDYCEEKFSNSQRWVLFKK